MPMLPPGHIPASVLIKDFKVISSAGEDLPVGELPFSLDYISFEPGLITWSRNSQYGVQAFDLHEPLTLKGVVSVIYPKALQTIRLPMKGMKTPNVLALGDGGVSIRHLSVNSYNGVDLRISWKKGGTPEHYVVWQEDDEGKRVSTLLSFERGTDASYVSVENGGIGSASNLCVARYIGKDEVLIPFQRAYVTNVAPSYSSTTSFKLIIFVGGGAILVALFWSLVLFRRR